MTYETLLNKAEKAGLTVKEKPLTENDGLIKGDRIAIRKGIPTQAEKSCVLAEELEHHFTTYGDILDQTDTINRKQEYRARLYGYNLKIGLPGILKAYEAGCMNLPDIAEYLDSTEEYLSDAIECYRKKYGVCTTIDNYIIYFEPNLGVMKVD